MITFKKLTWRNFLSTGNNPTEVLLDKNTTTLIVGNNGAGKSTILDALTFALFGKPFRNINKPNLCNSINGKNALVTIEFDVGTTSYKVVRGLKPNVFEIYQNGELINQDALAKDYQEHLEDNILKMSKKTFTQIVILGAASFLPFMQLPAGQRREIVENLLDINIFSLMNQALKLKMAAVKDDISKTETDITIIKNKIEVLQKYIKSVESDTEVRQNQILENIRTVEGDIDEFTKTINELIEKKIDLQSNIKGKPAAESLKSELTIQSRTISSTAKEIENNIKFYKENDVCPSCRQDISTDHCTKTLDEFNLKFEALKASAKTVLESIALVDDELRGYSLIESEISELDTSLHKFNARKLSAENLLTAYKKDLSSINSVNTLEDDKVSLKQLAKSGKELVDTKNELVEKKQYYDICGVMLKDSGIKARVVKQYLPVMNKLINKYLSDFDFFVSFELDESFNETIKSRYRDTFSYSSFSEGEKFRINLSILFTWRDIARLKNSASTNLLICDELLDGSLDQDALNALFVIFDKMENTNLFVISHHPDSYTEKFRSVIEFEKVGNYSVMKGK